MKRFLILALVLAGAQVATAQDWAKDALAKSQLKHEWATVGSNNVKTFVVDPPGTQKRPVCVMIPGEKGMTDWAQDMADQIANMGYVVVAPDLSMAPDAQVSDDLNAVADYGMKQPQATSTLMVVGFSKGGTQAFQFAADRSSVAATLIFYGTAPSKANIAKIQGILFGFYASDDPAVDSTLDQTKADLKAADVVMENVVYDNTKNGFMEAGMSPSATPDDKKAVAYALDRMKIVMEMVALRGY